MLKLNELAEQIELEIPKAVTQEGREQLQRALQSIYEAIVAEKESGPIQPVPPVFPTPPVRREQPRPQPPKKPTPKPPSKRDHLVEKFAQEIADLAGEKLSDLLNESGLDDLDEAQEFAFEIMAKAAKKITFEE